MPCVTLGRGSNTLFDDRGFEGVVAVNCIATLETVNTVETVDTVNGVHTVETVTATTAETPTPRFVEEGDDALQEAEDEAVRGGEYTTSGKRAAEDVAEEEEDDDDDDDHAETETTFASFRVGAGYPFNQLGAALSRDGWSGLEFAIGIPGTVGGAVFMNAGADGQDTAAALESVDVLSPDGRVKRVVAAERMHFGYRASPFQSPPAPGGNPAEEVEGDEVDEVDDDDDVVRRGGGAGLLSATDDVEGDCDDDDDDHRGDDDAAASAMVDDDDDLDLAGAVITAATFRMRRDAGAANRARECLRRRRATQPLAERSVGCVFRNPGPGALSAGALIDKSGLKGVTCGGASVSNIHANFLVYSSSSFNAGATAAAAAPSEDDGAGAIKSQSRDERGGGGGGGGGGGSREMEALIRRVKNDVFEATGYELHEELWRVPHRLDAAAPGAGLGVRRRRQPAGGSAAASATSAVSSVSSIGSDYDDADARRRRRRRRRNTRRGGASPR